MNLETLKLYCDVVRLRSFSRGAASNSVSQSAASQAIQQLEAELDAALLDRSRRPLLPTEQGQAFYDACRALLQGFEKARADLAAARERVEGTVRVAAIYSVGLHDMSRHMQPFMSDYPQARVLLECLHPHKVVEAVLNDEADLGILSYPAATRALTVLPLRDEPMVLVAHPAHRLARRRSVTPGDLQGEKFVAFDRDLAVRKAIDRALKQHDVKVDGGHGVRQRRDDQAGDRDQRGGQHPAAPHRPQRVGDAHPGGHPARAARSGAAGRDHPPPRPAAHAGGRALHRAAPEAPRPGLVIT